ncbi:hypothetical protein HWD03_gp070 [Alteromonas phage vB_AmeM_PT11-V22]|uniref:Uncharacterized protein n=1 Tax=Alteromonas phage vB_AmeM_PT11-V22 TaxID=2704031 RepID=A0A6C0R0R2_9CAUD|nr:hypothetical protein HWD03_gp070 [Alteromonas phage vB_AmeM_PT11-V22]QHZ59830.1 hypothetical protein [Alteromonas phage vB_AmeM_PT11-V22]
MKINLNINYVEPYSYPYPLLQGFGHIVYKGFTENGVRVEVYIGEDVGVHLKRNALFVHLSEVDLEGVVDVD